SGKRVRKSFTRSGRTLSEAVGTKLMRRLPETPSPARRAMDIACSAWASVRRASRRKTSPTWVSRTLRLLRSRSLRPRSSSSCRIALLSGGCDMLSRVAAFRKLSSSATATNCRSWRRSTGSDTPCPPNVHKPVFAISQSAPQFALRILEIGDERDTEPRRRIAAYSLWRGSMAHYRWYADLASRSVFHASALFGPVHGYGGL